ncbi:alpha/beta fold hydrolase [Cryptosporangium phraense]|uniref:Alpha/beta hydrolase n=1 Tax=Cryptosporangium phraense TaxID=2593070 RepID=A0A545AK59_9ACTN|nr:alpha/beta hydrolase [Cryptosporangium phraense]TQS41135.1 alpha/beta hydrolase [Cryptosporangium phraense]
MPYLDVSGTKLWYDEYGTGPDVVVSCASGFSTYPAVLAEPPIGARVFTLQARGFGRSDHQSEPPAQGWLDQWGDDVLALADHVGAERFVYTGVSHGAGIGWHLAWRHPERLRALISVVGTPHDRTGDTSSSAGRRKVIENRGNVEEIERQFQVLGGPTDTPEQAELRERTIGAIVRKHVTYTDEEARINQGMPFPQATTNDAVAAILRTIDLPVLILAGMRDGVISPESTLRAARSVKRAKAVLFEDEGHFVAEERPQRLVPEIAIFLDELAGAR